jgi:hypothetical protein
LPTDVGDSPTVVLVVLTSGRLGDGDGLVEAPEDGVSMRLAISAALATGGPGAAWSIGIGSELAVCKFDDDAGAAAALVSTVVARSSNNVRSVQTSVLPAAFSSAARFPKREMKSAKAVRTPGEVGNALRTTRGQVFSALSPGGEKACPAEICCSTWSRSAPSSASACTAGMAGGSPEKSLAAKALLPISRKPAQTAISRHVRPGLFRHPRWVFRSQQNRPAWN